MQVVKLIGPAGSGKTFALQTIYEQEKRVTLLTACNGVTIAALKKLLEDGLEVLLLDEVPPDMVDTLTEVVKPYPGFAFFAIQS